MTATIMSIEKDEYDIDPKHKGGDNTKCVVCGVDLGSATFGKICMRCHDEMIKRSS